MVTLELVELSIWVQFPVVAQITKTSHFGRFLYPPVATLDGFFI